MAEFSLKRPLFGGEVEITLFDIDELSAQEIVDRAYLEGVRLEKIFNLYDKSSEISRLNRERRLAVSNELRGVLRKAIELCEISNGEYDISIGRQIRERKEGRPEGRISCSFRDIGIIGNLVVLNNPEVYVDLGSIAKGFIVDSIAEILETEGVLRFFVDGRGDIRIAGGSIVGVQHPRERDKLIGRIKMTTGGVATSGDYNQHCGDFEKSHIINGKEYISVSVVAPSLEIADAYATAFFVSDEKSREKLLENKEVRIMAIDRNLRVIYFNKFEELLENEN